jgi:GNAT superfamily N-acetyltransferase
VLSRWAAKTHVERAGTDEKSFRDVFELLLALHREGGYAPLNLDKTAKNCFDTLTENMTFIARDDNGRAIGVLGMSERDFWFSDHTFLYGAWFYVRPKHRKGRVGVELMRAAAREGDARNKIVFIGTDNPDRRPKKTTMSLHCLLAGYVPLGYDLKLR